MYWKEEAFTFFQIFLFVFPVLIDISYSALDSKTMDLVRKLFLLLNIFIMAVCVLGLTNIMTDTGNSFCMNLEVIGFKFEITKRRLSLVMLLNVIIPILYYACSPCRRNEKTIAGLHKL